MRISQDVIGVLDRCETDGARLVLPGQLDRRDYVAVNKVIEEAGGKWNRREKAHLFDGDAAEIVDRLITAGEVTAAHKVTGYFSSPPAVVDQLISLARLGPDMTALEPSAGTGAIVSALVPLVSAVVAVEIDHGRSDELRRQGFTCLHEGDFLALDQGGLLCDRVIMNPPFARHQDVAHVMHALEFLRPGRGLLVSVMSLGVTFRQDRASAAFRDLVERSGGEFVPVPDGSFRESGTDVSTVIAVVRDVS